MVTLALVLLALGSREAATPIDRHALVTRHNPVIQRLDPESPLSVGNGEFAFTADVTGLQTFPELYDQTIPLGTLSQWGWHTFPNPYRWSIDRFAFKEFDNHGRRVGYADIPGDVRTPEINWLRANPHRLHLGRIGFHLVTATGRPAAPEDLKDIEQTLDLWNGALLSRFTLDGVPVTVETVSHPQRDLLAVRVISPLARQGRLAIRLRFPYGAGQTTAADWNSAAAHETVLPHRGLTGAGFARRLDGDAYHVAACWAPAGRIEEVGAREFLVSPTGTDETLEFVAAFAPTPLDDVPGFELTRVARAITGTVSGRPAAPLISPAAGIPAGGSSSGASSCPST